MKENNILILRSSFQADQFVEKEYASLLQMLKEDCQANFFILGEEQARNKIPEFPKPDYIITATGGVEALFVKVMPLLKEEIILIADGRNNSLAAALEILSYLRTHGKIGRIVHGTTDEIAKEIRVNAPINNVLPSDITTSTQQSESLFTGLKIGCFGPASDWLISSDVDRMHLKKKFGIEIIDIPLSNVIEKLQQQDESSVIELASKMSNRAKGIVEPDKNDLIKSMKVYLTLKQICQEQQLAAMTIRCFDIVNCCQTTSCMALALLNDEGIVAGCEGDLQTLLTMVLAQRLCHEKAFMANPSQLSATTAMLAHCTIPTEMCSEFVLRSHFESSIGVAITGMLPIQEYTLLKWGGDKMNRFFVAEAESEVTRTNEHYCRTQITLKADLRSYLLQQSIGNHQVVIKGGHAKTIRTFMEKNGIAEVR